MMVFFRHVATPPGSQSRQHPGNRIGLARDSLFPHQVDAGIGDRPPDRRTGVAVDIGLHDRENHRDEGRHTVTRSPGHGRSSRAQAHGVRQKVSHLDTLC